MGDVRQQGADELAAGHVEQPGGRGRGPQHPVVARDLGAQLAGALRDELAEERRVVRGGSHIVVIGANVRVLIITCLPARAGAAAPP